MWTDVDACRSGSDLGDGWTRRWAVSWRAGGDDAFRLVHDLVQEPLLTSDPMRHFTWCRDQRHCPGLQFLTSTGRHHGVARLEEDRVLSPQHLESSTGATVLDGLACEIARVCVDFTQYPESYYFHDGPGHTSLPRTIHFASELAAQAQRSEQPGIRLAASALAAALDDLAAVLDERFLHTGQSRQQILAAYAGDHGRH